MTNTQPAAATPSRAARMRSVLTEAFRPIRLDIIDDSARHAGHAGAGGGEETHFSISIVSDAFRSRTRLERSRMVNAALVSEFETGLHALSLILNSPVDDKS